VPITSDQSAIMVIDSSDAFATMIREYLEQEGGYRVTAKESGAAALEALDADEYSLAILDLGLRDEDGATVAHHLRHKQADLRLILLPVDGDSLPPEVVDLDVQGVLPKPFFLPDLLPCVARALDRPESAGSSQQAETTAAPVRTAPIDPQPVAEGADISDVVPRLRNLARELSADAVILSRQERVLAQATRLTNSSMKQLIRLVVDSWRTSAHLAHILGKDQLGYEHSIEGKEYVFYSVTVSGDVLLSVVIGHSVPLGILRHQARTTADRLRAEW